VGFLRRLLGEKDALDDAARRAGAEVHEGEVDVGEAPAEVEEPADLPVVEEEGEPPPRA
jgi:hypothetical protein